MEGRRPNGYFSSFAGKSAAGFSGLTAGTAPAETGGTELNTGNAVK
jgi:hypothetical protein